MKISFDICGYKEVDGPCKQISQTHFPLICSFIVTENWLIFTLSTPLTLHYPLHSPYTLHSTHKHLVSPLSYSFKKKIILTIPLHEDVILSDNLFF